MAEHETTETIDFEDQLRTLEMPDNDPIMVRDLESPEIDAPMQTFDEFEPQKPNIAERKADEAMILIQHAIQQKADPKMLEPLMDLHERYLARISKEKFNKAMAGFFSEIPRIEKNVEVGFKAKGGEVNYKYASLDHAMRKIAPILSKYGLYLNWRVDQPDDGYIIITAYLCHEDGHEISTSFKAPPDTTGTKNPVQSIGSTISYGKRYTAFSLLGLSMGEDDNDGAGADEIGSFITGGQVLRIKQRIAEKNTTISNVELFLKKAFNIESIETIPVSQFDQILKSLN